MPEVGADHSIPTLKLLQKVRSQNICEDNDVNMTQIKELQFMCLDGTSDTIQEECLQFNHKCFNYFSLLQVMHML